MSKDNFVDELVKKTGKNGHELFDYLIDVLNNHSAEETTQKAAIPITIVCSGRYEFSGSRQELIELLTLHGADCRGVGGVSPYGLCIYAARVLKVNEFIWHRPIQKKDKSGKIFYSAETEEAFLDYKGNEIFTH